MATGSGIPQPGGIVTSDITPAYAIPHDHAIADALGNAGDAAQGLVNGLIKKHYDQQAAKAGADGAQATADVARISADPNGSDAALEDAKARQDAASRYAAIPVITDVGRARQAAFQGAYLAGIKTDIDGHFDQLQRDHATDPAAFKDASQSVVSGYAKGAPGQFAVQVQQYAASKADASFQTLSNQKLQRDQVTSVNSLNARQQSLTDDLTAMAAAGQDGSREYMDAKAEWDLNQAQKVSNPLFEFSPEQAAEADSHQTEALQGAVLTHHATLAYNNAGGGEAGKAAALDVLKTEALDDGGALAGMPPGQRLKLYAAASANVRDLDKADAERRAIAAEQERKQRADQRDNAGNMALGLVDGSVSEADIHAAEAKGDIEPGSAAALIRSSRAAARTAAAQERMIATQERTAAYGAMAELASNNQLTPAMLAQNGGSLTPVQRIALKGKLDKNAKPGIDNITGLASAGFKDAGIQGAQAKLAIENLHADAATYMAANPGASVGQQAGFASEWLKKNKGIVVSPVMTPPNSVVQTHAQYTAAYKARFHGQGVNDSDVEAGWKRYQSTHPTAK